MQGCLLTEAWRSEWGAGEERPERPSVNKVSIAHRSPSLCGSHSAGGFLPGLANSLQRGDRLNDRGDGWDRWCDGRCVHALVLQRGLQLFSASACSLMFPERQDEVRKRPGEVVGPIWQGFPITAVPDCKIKIKCHPLGCQAIDTAGLPLILKDASASEALVRPLEFREFPQFFEKCGCPA